MLAVAAHSWAHVPLSTLLHLVDVAALLEHADAAEVALLARRWGMQRMWRATLAGRDWALYGRRPRSPMRYWAGNVAAVRERTVIESHLARCTAAFWALPPRQAAAAAGAARARRGAAAGRRARAGEAAPHAPGAAARVHAALRSPHGAGARPRRRTLKLYSTVTVFARLRGWSTFRPRSRAIR